MVSFNTIIGPLSHFILWLVQLYSFNMDILTANTLEASQNHLLAEHGLVYCDFCYNYYMWEIQVASEYLTIITYMDFSQD